VFERCRDGVRAGVGQAGLVAASREIGRVPCQRLLGGRAAPRRTGPSEELAQLLAAGPAPVFVGFGSMVISPKQSARLSRIVFPALAELGARASFQAN
jgi:UDP:flavonoid glycosyltransferase YjiC (YdhE family)